MASTIRIKRTTTNGSPGVGTLSGELGYSYLAGTQGNGGDRLYIGNQTPGNNPVVIGGKYFTDMLDHVKGTLTADSAIITDTNSLVDQIKAGTTVLNLTLGTNIITADGTSASDLPILFTPKNEGTLRVVQQGGAAAYETLVLDDDDIPNKRYVDLQVQSASTLTVRDEANADQGIDLGADVLKITGGEGIDTAVTRLVDDNGVGSDTVVLTISGELTSSTNLGIAQFSASYFTVTAGDVAIDDATSTTKGIASFNSTNFTVTTGDVTSNDITIGTTALTLGEETLVLAGLQQLDVDNLRLDGNTISSTDGNGNIILDPDGAGVVVIDELNFSSNIIQAAGAGTDININLSAKGTGVIDVANDAAGETRIVNVADPVADADAANKRYVDEVAQGLTVRPSARAITTTNLVATYDNGTLGVGATLTADANGAFPVIDGVGDNVLWPNAWLEGDRVLVVGQTNLFENGLYVITDLGDAGTPWVLTRDEYVDDKNEIPSSYVFVQQGTVYNSTGWTAIVEDFGQFDVGIDDIDWYQFSGAGSLTEGDGINLAGTVVSVDLSATGSGLTFAAGTSGNALIINPLIAGAGLTYDASGTGILNIGGTTDRITINADSIDIAATYAGQNTIITLGTVTTGTWNADTITVPYGGTGFVSATSNGIVYGNGTGALQVTAAGTWDATNGVGQFLSVNSSNVPTWTNTIDGGEY